MTSPTDRREPRARSDDRRSLVERRHVATRAVEPPCRRPGIDAARAAQMLPEVIEHVHERVPYFAGRRQQARMIPVSPHATVAPENAIDRLRDANRQAAYASLESDRVVRFDEQVDVVALDAVVQNAKGAVARGGERGSRCGERALMTERRDAGGGAQRDVSREAAIVRHAAPMRHASASQRRLAARAVARAAPCAGAERQLLRAGPHLNRAYVYRKLANVSSASRMSGPFRAPRRFAAVTAPPGCKRRARLARRLRRCLWLRPFGTPPASALTRAASRNRVGRRPQAGDRSVSVPPSGSLRSWSGATRGNPRP